jgi:hypothetical protein
MHSLAGCSNKFRYQHNVQRWRGFCLHKYPTSRDWSSLNKTEISFSPYPRDSKTFIYRSNRKQNKTGTWLPAYGRTRLGHNCQASYGRTRLLAYGRTRLLAYGQTRLPGKTICRTICRTMAGLDCRPGIAYQIDATQIDTTSNATWIDATQFDVTHKSQQPTCNHDEIRNKRLDVQQWRNSQ